jgi:hypothetical protein
MKTKITITHNGFHGYTSRALVVDGKPGEKVKLTSSQIKKLERAACGMKDCTCGESLIPRQLDAWNWMPGDPIYITIPKVGTEIEINGNYPQR